MDFIALSSVSTLTLDFALVCGSCIDLPKFVEDSESELLLTGAVVAEGELSIAPGPFRFLDRVWDSDRVVS